MTDNRRVLGFTKRFDCRLRVKCWPLSIGCLLACVLFATVVAANVVCRSPDGIAGFEDQYRHATRYVGEDTSIPSQLRVYFEVDDSGALYAHSNFVTPTMIEDHDHKVERNVVPTKIAIDKGFIPLDEIILNLTGRGHAPTGKARGSIQLFVHPSVLRSQRWKELDFSVGDVRLLQNGKERSARQVIVDGDRKWIVSHRNHVYTWVDDIGSEPALDRLDRLKYSQDDIAVLPLTTDSRTMSTLRHGEVTLIKWSAESQDIDSLVAASPAPVLLVLGHFEKGSFVVRAADGRQVLTLDLQLLYALAERHHKTILPIGCNTAALGRAGVATTFNTASVAERLVRARTAESIGQFISSIAGENVDLVMDAKTARSIEFSVFATRRTEAGRQVDNVGRIAVILPPIATVAATTAPGTSVAGSNGQAGAIQPVAVSAAVRANVLRGNFPDAGDETAAQKRQRSAVGCSCESAGNVTERSSAGLMLGLLTWSSKRQRRKRHASAY